MFDYVRLRSIVFLFDFVRLDTPGKQARYSRRKDVIVREAPHVSNASRHEKTDQRRDRSGKEKDGR